jgi:alcohol dehydrogenase class IV
MQAQICLPSIMQIGRDALNNLIDVMTSLSVQRPCIITDSTMRDLGFVAKVERLLCASEVEFAVFDGVMPEPDDRSIADAVTLVNESSFDCLIALGGGSAIDSAKAIALLASHGGHMRDYKVPHVIHQQSIPVIAIPTTAGTGSECTKVTIISDSKSSQKMLCMGPGLMPKAAIIDYTLSLTLPFRVAADTGIDALTHAIEAYVSRKANLFSDQQAISAMKLISANLVKACEEPSNTEAKEAMMLGASLAGIAFSNASVALVHGMSRPLGVHFHVPHGLSNAMLLPQITAFSLIGNARKYAECAVHMGLIDSTKNESQAHEALLIFLQNVNARLKVPSMSEFGIDKNQYKQLISTMTEQAIASGSPANNPRLAKDNEIAVLYEQVFS